MTVVRVSCHIELESVDTVRVQVSGWRDNSTLAWCEVLHVSAGSPEPDLKSVMECGLRGVLERIYRPVV